MKIKIVFLWRVAGMLFQSAPFVNLKMVMVSTIRAFNPFFYLDFSFAITTISYHKSSFCFKIA